MKVFKDQSGFSVFEMILIVAVLGILAVVTLRVIDSRSKTPSSTNPVATSKKASDVSSAPAVNKASDLSKAENTLDQNDPSTANTGDTNQLDTELAGN